jgi:signal transduction histidine kinase
MAKMTPRQKARTAFLSAVMLLAVAAGVGYLTISRLIGVQHRAVRTHQIQATLAEIDFSVGRTARAGIQFLASGNEEHFVGYESALAAVAPSLRETEALALSPEQQALLLRLQELTRQRLELLQRSVELKRAGTLSSSEQAETTIQLIALGAQSGSISQQVYAEEEQALARSTHHSERLFRLTMVLVSVTLVSALMLFVVHYRLLNQELAAREQAEGKAIDSEASLRQLTAKLLQLQDEERRRLARELHDSLGQYLAAIKMSLSTLSLTSPEAERLAEPIELLDRSIAETRTISHLLHPPLLEEAGFRSAAKWYVDGFVRRSNIQVSLNMPDDLTRLSDSLALGLFRILQECLTNIHRHSRSSKADIVLTASSTDLVMIVRDYGTGIPHELLRCLNTSGSHLGVGLAGMRERVRELGGLLNIESSTNGTVLEATIPLPAEPAHHFHNAGTEYPSASSSRVVSS